MKINTQKYIRRLVSIYELKSQAKKKKNLGAIKNFTNNNLKTFRAFLHGYQVLRDVRQLEFPLCNWASAFQMQLVQKKQNGVSSPTNGTPESCLSLHFYEKPEQHWRSGKSSNGSIHFQKMSQVATQTPRPQQLIKRFALRKRELSLKVATETALQGPPKTPKKPPDTRQGTNCPPAPRNHCSIVSILGCCSSSHL